MDFAADNGVGWRQQIQRDLADLGIVWLDPTNKPTDQAVEDNDTKRLLADAKSVGNYDYIVHQVKVIRNIDLRLVDIADFLIVHLDTNIYSFGTIEEIANANREKKPIIVHVEQGKAGTPSWLFGMIGHKDIFSTWDELKQRVRTVATDPSFNDLCRWHFFNLHHD